MGKRFHEGLSYRGLRGGLLAALFLAASSCGGSEKPAQSADDVATSTSSDMPPPAPPPRASDTAAEPETMHTQAGKFDEHQVQVVLARAAKNAHTCVEVAGADQPHGDATVTVTFSGKGKSTKATLPPPYEGTQIGACATRAFENIIIPPFDGADVDKTFAVDLKSSPAPEKKPEGKKKK